MLTLQIEECLDNWVFTLFCIETHSFYVVNGEIAYTHNYDAIKNARLNLETESGLHFDIRAINGDALNAA
jgi:hypothetical protein